MLGDDALIMSHRLQEWLARAPELEEETALANIALDLLGQARLLLSRAGRADGTSRDEDDYAFGRAASEFRNVTLAEAADADFGGLIARLLVFSTWRLALLTRLRASRDPVLAAVAAQGVREITYHRDYAAQWLLRLAGGTDYSRARMVAGTGRCGPADCRAIRDLRSRTGPGARRRTGSGRAARRGGRRPRRAPGAGGPGLARRPRPARRGRPSRPRRRAH